MPKMDGSKGQEKKQQQQALLDRAFDRLVGSQLSALQAKGSKKLTEEDEARYRATLAAEREAAEKKKRKVLSAEHAELARAGLSGQVVAMMAQAGDDGEDDADGRGDRKTSSKKRSKKSRKGSSRKSSGSKRKKKDRKKSSSSSKHRRSRSYSSDSYSSRSSYSSYSSYTSDSYSSSSGSFSGDRKKSKKKHRSKSKESKKRKHKHKSSKSECKRDKKKSRRGDDDREKATATNTSSTSNLTSQFGKYGIIRESDFTGNNEKVRRSFEMWLAEVKGVASFTGPKYELLEFFKEYAEDFNTATLPHMKYYDYDKWEMEDYAKKKQEAESAAMGGGSKARSDEFKHREEMKKREEEKRRAEVELMRATVSAKRDEMKNQAFLKAELENAYKTGDQDKIRKIKRRLEPEERR